MRLNRSNRQIAKLLGLNKNEVHAMSEQQHVGIVMAKPVPRLQDELAYYEVYGMAGHTDNTAAVDKKTVQDRGG